MMIIMSTARQECRFGRESHGLTGEFETEEENFLIQGGDGGSFFADGKGYGWIWCGGGRMSDSTTAAMMMTMNNEDEDHDDDDDCDDDEDDDDDDDHDDDHDEDDDNDIQIVDIQEDLESSARQYQSVR
jgi:hypothetical protein